MPGRVLFWMSTLHVDDQLKRLVKPEHMDKASHPKMGPVEQQAGIMEVALLA